MVHEHDLITRKNGYSSTVPAKLYQFPLNLSYAQTAHRMQGQTVKAGTKVIIHWVKAMKRGMAYVMLGRSQRLEDIYIAGELDPSQIKCDQEALKESERLEEIFNNNQAEEAERRSKMWKISYLNVRSLNAHLNDVKKDNFLLDSDLLGLAETWIDEGNFEDIFALDDFAHCHANAGRGKGLSGYTKMKLVTQPEIISTTSHSAILFRTDNFDIIFLYLSSDYNRKSVFTTLENWIQPNRPTAVIGDVNEDFLDNPNITHFMRIKGFYQMIDKPTCETGSLLDHIYVNNAMDQLGFTTRADAAYYSDHDIVSLYVSK